MNDTIGYCEAGLENNLNGTLLLYPNPTTGIINITVKGYNITKAEIYDINGRKVQATEKASGISSANVSALANGIYMLNVYSGEMAVVKKIVKQ